MNLCDIIPLSPLKAGFPIDVEFVADTGLKQQSFPPTVDSRYLVLAANSGVSSAMLNTTAS